MADWQESYISIAEASALFLLGEIAVVSRAMCMTAYESSWQTFGILT